MCPNHKSPSTFFWKTLVEETWLGDLVVLETYGWKTSNAFILRTILVIFRTDPVIFRKIIFVYHIQCKCVILRATWDRNFEVYLSLAKFGQFQPVLAKFNQVYPCWAEFCQIYQVFYKFSQFLPSFAEYSQVEPI